MDRCIIQKKDVVIEEDILREDKSAPAAISSSEIDRTNNYDI
jgi:hypothetical protein